MDLIIRDVFKAYYELDNYRERDFRSILFESDDGVEEHNEGVVQRAAKSLRNAIDKLIEVFKGLIQKIKDKFKEIAESEKEKEAKKRLEQLMKDFPELRSEKISIIDVDAYSKMYDECLEKLRKESQKETPSDATADDIIHNLDMSVKEMASESKGGLLKLAKKGMAIVTLESAMGMAHGDFATAQIMNKTLEYEVDELDGLRDILGADKVDMAKEKINKSANKVWLSRMMSKIFVKKSDFISHVIGNRYSRMLGDVKSSRAKRKGFK